MKQVKGNMKKVVQPVVKAVNNKNTRANRARAARAIGATIGRRLGDADTGAMVGGALARFTGIGDYQLVYNSLLNGNANGMSRLPRRGVRVAEREYIGQIVSGALVGGSSVFTNTSYPINPSDPNVFPWLSNLARLYDQWEPHGILFEFVSTSSDYAALQALGTVVYATDYDPYDAEYTSKQEMEGAAFTCSTKPSLNMVHGVECDPSQRPTPLLYTDRTNGAPLTSTSLGNFQVATSGCAAAGITLGELWVSYDITFHKKQIPVGISSDHYVVAGTSAAGGAALYTHLPYVGNTPGLTISPTQMNFSDRGSMDMVLVVFYEVGVLPDITLLGTVSFLSNNTANHVATTSMTSFTLRVVGGNTWSLVFGDTPYESTFRISLYEIET